jgi:hypothetical protein
MSLVAYKLLHIAGVLFLFAALGGSVIANRDGTAGAAARKLTGITHGLALLLIVFAGFGALAKLGLTSAGLPGWVWGKLVIWVLLGAAPFVLRKKPSLAVLFWWLLPILGATAAALALYGPE